MTNPFAHLPRVAKPGAAGPGDLAFAVYDPDRPVMGRRMADWLRPAVAYWHSFAATGADPFGLGTWPRPWAADESRAGALAKAVAAFDFMACLGLPFFCFHDRDVAPERDTLAESHAELRHMEEPLQAHMARTGIRLLWGTANLTAHPRYAAGAATNPDPAVFAYAAGRVRHALEMTHRLGGENYVLWGGREGYDTLLNTDLRREQAQLARFLTLVVEHKHKIGFTGQILVEPKPMEPAKHQYDHDVETVAGFLHRAGLQHEVQLNIEANHATLAGHSFEHEVTMASALGLLGSIDINRGDAQNGWDTDQFPDNAQALAPAMLAVLRQDGLGTGGFNFDAKLRRQSIDPADLLHAHIGGIDALARALLVAEALVTDARLAHAVEARYAGWNGPLGQDILAGKLDLCGLDRWAQDAPPPAPVSGAQERLENIVADTAWRAA